MELTVTQKRILTILSDGKRHRKIELKEALKDKEADVKTVVVHIVNIRKKINPIGQDIICEYYNRRIHYRWVRLISVK